MRTVHHFCPGGRHVAVCGQLLGPNWNGEIWEEGHHAETLVELADLVAASTIQEVCPECLTTALTEVTR